MAVPLLRGERAEGEALLGALAEIWVHGTGVDWARVFAGCGAQRVALPTYAFQRERYWLVPSLGAGDMASAGISSVDHPLLGATVALAEDRGPLFTGRLSLQEHAWLSDHVVLGVCVVPGAAFVELALYVGSQVGCDLVEELVMEAPLVLGEQDTVQLQVSVDESDEAGRRLVKIYSRAEDTAGDGLQLEEAWTRHASGVLASDGTGAEDRGKLDERVASLAGPGWPPEGAVAVDLDDFYGHMAEIGFDYGPAFFGVQSVWRRGEEVFAELSLSDNEQAQASRFGLHPALFDAGLQGIVASVSTSRGDEPRLPLPFSFNGVRLYAEGASALRVHLSPAGTDGMSLLAVDESGALVASMRSLILRPVSRKQLAGARGGYLESLFRLDWTTVPVASSVQLCPRGVGAAGGYGSGLVEAVQGAGVCPEVYKDLQALSEAVDGGAVVPSLVLVDCTVNGCGSVDAGAAGGEVAARGVGEMARQLVHRVLDLLQDWLVDERFSASRLVLITQGAVAAGAGDDLPGLTQSPVWGLVRSAQSEHPGRFVLVDVDDEDASARHSAGGAGER